MPFQIDNPLGEYDDAALAALLTAGREALASIDLTNDNITDEDLTEAERVSGLVAGLVTETDTRAQANETAAAERAARLAAVRANAPVVEPVAPVVEPVVVEASAVTAPGVVEVRAEDLLQSPAESDAEFAVRQERTGWRDETNRPATATARQRVAAASRRPVVPERQTQGSLVASAAADVPGYSSGADLDIVGVASALIARTRGFSAPSGDGKTEDLRRFGVASLRKDFPQDLVASGLNDDAVLERATDESRLPGNSLVASGGWCAPSETLYDFCSGETTEGLVSIPEIQVSRGGIRFTPGVDFTTIYNSVGFSLTEAQAIAGVDKTCYEVPCPAFTEIRLDAIGLCIKVPILTQAAYPELVSDVIAKALVAHQHKVSNRVVLAIQTAAGAALVGPDQGSITQSLFAILELRAATMKQRYRFSLNMSLEVLLPFWVKGAIKSDIAGRTGVDVSMVSDEQVNSLFTMRGFNPQWLYGFQPLPDGAVGYPATFQVLLYPAGAFVKGTSDVISLNAVYDAASLVENIYTGLFVEEGILIAAKCYDADLLTVPVCIAGRTGAANVVNCGLAA